MPGLFLIIFFILLACIGLAAWLMGVVLDSAEKSQLVGKLRTPSASMTTTSSPIFIEEISGPRSEAPALVRRIIRALGDRAAAAGTEWSGTGVLASCVALALIGGAIGWRFPLLIFPWLTSLVLGLALGCLPLVVISSKRSTRLREFEEQFPEALDFIARAIRAGHAFSVSLEMLASEAPEPGRAEWQRVFREHNLGSPLESALIGMAHRVPLVDVKFFVSAVIMQREAGGNLSEILTNLATTVRERFRLKGHIRACTAHARITALMLTVIPLVTLVGLQIQSPAYLKILWSAREGQYMLLGAFLGQAIGYFLMRRVIDIKV